MTIQVIKSKLRNYEFDMSYFQSGGVIVKENLFTVKSSEGPLPGNYELPVNYPRDVVEGLQKKELSTLQRSKLVTTIAGNPFQIIRITMYNIMT